MPIEELVACHAALNFLYPRKHTPIFGNDRVEVTREAAKHVANVCNSLVESGKILEIQPFSI